MGRAGEAIRARVRAPPVRVDGPAERDQAGIGYAIRGSTLPEPHRSAYQPPQARQNDEPLRRCIPATSRLPRDQPSVAPSARTYVRTRTGSQPSNNGTCRLAEVDSAVVVGKPAQHAEATFAVRVAAGTCAAILVAIGTASAAPQSPAAAAPAIPAITITAPRNGASHSGSIAVKTVHYAVWAYVNPLKAIADLHASRIDMGVDYSGSGPILAIGEAKVIFARANVSGPESCWGRTCAPPGSGMVVYDSWTARSQTGTCTQWRTSPSASRRGRS